MRILFAVAVAVMILAMQGSAVFGQNSTLESRVDRLEHHHDKDAGGLALFLFGAFSALWAQNTGRNAWLWFFLGLFFSVITVLVLLYKNAQDRAAAKAGPA